MSVILALICPPFHSGSSCPSLGRRFIYGRFFICEAHAGCNHDQTARLIQSSTHWVDYGDRKRSASDVTAPIRIQFDTSNLDNDRRTCYHVGDHVTVGSSASTSCSATVTSNCDYTCTAADILTPTKRSFIVNELLPYAVQFYADTLQVTPVAGPLTWSPSPSCGTLNVPFTSVANADLVILISSRPVPGGMIQATGVECAEDQNGRATLGSINFNPTLVSVTPGNHSTWLGVATHEMAHVLGFSFKKIENFRNRTDYSVLPTSSIYQIVTRDYGSKSRRAVVIVLPTVLQFARQHFGCNTLDGLELEDGGNNGTAYSHWEKRIMNNEYMTGSSSQNPIFSVLTLALLHDSGWYRANFSRARGVLAWGRGQGCPFVMKSCSGWTNLQGGCLSADASACTFDYQAKAYCDYGLASSALPSVYQYFTNPNAGGASMLADYCPQYMGYSNGNCYDTNQQPADSDNYLGESFSNISKCYSSTVLPTNGVQLSTKGPLAACVSPDLLKVRVDSTWYSCTTNTTNTTIRVVGTAHRGTFQCPDVTRLCASDTPLDDTWPVIVSVDPTSGGSVGTLVTVKGRNFGANSGVVIGSVTLTGVNMSANGTIITGYLGKSKVNNYDPVSALIVTNLDTGKTDVAYNAFSIDPVPAIDVLLSVWYRYPAYVGVIGFFVAFGIVLPGVGRYIYHERKIRLRKMKIHPMPIEEEMTNYFHEQLQPHVQEPQYLIQPEPRHPQPAEPKHVAEERYTVQAEPHYETQDIRYVTREGPPPYSEQPRADERSAIAVMFLKKWSVVLTLRDLTENARMIPVLLFMNMDFTFPGWNYRPSPTLGSAATGSNVNLALWMHWK
ncbi:hypothetical protein PROFUN_14625 [Planoprotostelium fungivorum]|uniref:IPT/TIG domain-containing protein n=1 Tax=Planoprotostelium fungivorum TaxID=1890364 RepID=A0A2P6N932_9EUKA|nr:hypothetical protein PROFUN_14625 [Planoprotostelium fungivorum]